MIKHERLINAFVTNRNTNDKEIAILERFIEQYNKNNPTDPIKPVNFDDLRMKNFTKGQLSVKDSLKAIGVSFLISSLFPHSFLIICSLIFISIFSSFVAKLLKLLFAEIFHFSAENLCLLLMHF